MRACLCVCVLVRKSQDRSVDIVTRLCVAMFGFRFPAVGIDHRSPVETGTGDHPAFYAVGTDGSFDGGSAVGA